MGREEGEWKGGTRYSACLQCTQSCYRTHGYGKPNYEADSSSFFKVMLNGFSDKLKIPPMFVDQVKDQMGPDIVLEGPSGQLWHAKLRYMGAGMTIEHGWKFFISDHAIELGDFLVFKRSGKSHFTVQIFGRSGCEKKSAFTVRSTELQTENLNHEKQGDKIKNTQNPSFIATALCVGIEDKTKEDTTERPGTHITESALECTAIDDEMYACSAAPKRYERLQNLQATYIESARPESIATPSECRKISKTGKPVKGVERLTRVFSSDDKIKMQGFKSQKNKNKIYVSKHVNVSKHRKAINEAMSCKTRNLAFLIIMRRSHVREGKFQLSFPLDVRRSWFPDSEVGFTLLGPDKEKWPVTSPQKDMKRHSIKGWRNFAEYYNLKQGDICIFELVKSKLLTLKVHFFRKADRISARKKGGISKTKNETSGSKDCVSTEDGFHEIQVEIKPEEEFPPNVSLISPVASCHANILKQGQCGPGCQEAKESLGCRGHGGKKCCCLLKETEDDDFIMDGYEYPENKYSSEVMNYNPSVENTTGYVLSKRNKLLNDERDHMPTLVIDEKPYFLRSERHKRQTRPNAGVSCKIGVQTAALKRDLRCSDVIELE